MEAPLVPEVLLQHGQFVRALARSLLRDAHAAEDVAQETWARYLERGPAEGSGVRRWLAVVARNLAANLGRGERRRAARDREAARPEAMPPAQEELEHAELLGAVVESVLALDEPYRDTIVARYYRGLDAQAIAARSGTTAATVRSREHRALEKLRERLDRKFKDERAAWAAVLARIAGPPAGEGAGSSSSAWPLALATAVPVVAVVVAGAMLWQSSRAPAGVSLAGTQVAGVAPSEPEPASSEPASLAPAVPSSARKQRTPVGGQPVGRVNSTNASFAEIRGRFVFPGGAPAAGTPVSVMGLDGSQERVLQYGKPENWVDPRGETDADGRFALHFDPPRAFQFLLDAKAPGHAGAHWRWSEIQSGTTIDLGEVELPVGGTIEGRIVDAKGNALVDEEWSVDAITTGLSDDQGRDESLMTARVDRATASFRLEDVWPCRIELSAHSEQANIIEGPPVVVQSGETLTADIVYSGPSNQRRITVWTSCRPFHTQGFVEAEHVRLIGPKGEVRTAPQLEFSSESHSFEDLGPGSYTVEIDDPRFIPWTRAGVQPGESVNARLVGASALHLSVVDEGGDLVERYSVRLTLRSSSSRPNEFVFHDGESVLDGGLVSGMVPGDWTIDVHCEYGWARGETNGLARGETRDVRLELHGQVFVGGRVTHPDGSGVRDAVVQLLAPAAKEDSDMSPILEPDVTANPDDMYRRELASADTDSSGVFRIEVTSPGPFLLRASLEGTQAFSLLFTLDQAADRFELVLSRSGSVRGRIHASGGASFDGLSLWIAPSSLWDAEGKLIFDMQHTEWMRRSLDQSRTSLAADGSFLLEDLPPGQSRAFLVINEAVATGFTGSADGVDGTLRLADLDVPSGGTLDRDFTALELPGWIELDLLADGQPAPFVEVTLLGPMSVEGLTDRRGHFGPKRVLTGTWSVSARDRKAGWDGPVPGKILVEPGEHVSTVLDVPVIRGTVTCVDAEGRPIASETVTLVHFDANRPGKIRSYTQLQPRRTDKNGRLELFLVPGEYGLVRVAWNYDRRWEEVARPHVPLTWTTSGPLVERVQL